MDIMAYFTMGTGGHYITMLVADWSISASHDSSPSGCHSELMLWNPSIQPTYLLVLLWTNKTVLIGNKTVIHTVQMCTHYILYRQEEVLDVGVHTHTHRHTSQVINQAKHRKKIGWSFPSSARAPMSTSSISLQFYISCFSTQHNYSWTFFWSLPWHALHT